MSTITSSYIGRKLTENNCCAATKGNNRILLLQKGEDCQEIVDDCELMINIIDTLSPYATIYKQSTYTFIVNNDSGDNGTIIISINGVNIASVGPAFVYASTISDAISSQGDYSSYYNDTSVIISGKNGSDSNGYVIVISATNVTVNTPLPIQLSGGEDYLSRNTNTCLTLPQINNMLQFLCKLCDSSCNTNLT